MSSDGIVMTTPISYFATLYLLELWCRRRWFILHSLKNKNKKQLLTKFFFFLLVKPIKISNYKQIQKKTIVFHGNRSSKSELRNLKSQSFF